MINRVKGRLVQDKQTLKDECSKEFNFFTVKPGVELFKTFKTTKVILSLKSKLPKLKVLKKSKNLLGMKKDVDDVKCINRSTSILDMGRCEEHKKKRSRSQECARCYFGDHSFACSCDA